MDIPLFERMWQDFVSRTDGPLHFRFVLQPLMATIFGIRDGIQDAKTGRPAYLWTICFTKEHRDQYLKEGIRHVLKVLILAIVLDAIYQLIVQRGVYVGELLIVATSLAVVPYVLLRGPVSRIARWLARGQAFDNEGDPPESDDAPQP